MDRSNLLSFITGATLYFNNLDYVCDATDVFKFISQVNGDIDIKILLKSLYTHSKADIISFDKDYDNYCDLYFKYSGDVYLNKLETLNNNLDDYSKRLKSLEIELNSMKEQYTSLYINKLKDIEKECPEITKTFEKDNVLNNIENIIKGDKSFPQKKEIVDSTQKAYCNLPLSHKRECALNINKRINLLKEIKTTIEDPKFNKMIKEKQKLLENITDETGKKEDILLIINKEKSLVHREEFINPHRAIQCIDEGESIPNKNFKSMNNQEKKQVYEYIQNNIKSFKTRINRRIRHSKKQKLLLDETIKKACATNGIPLELTYQKPKNNKADLVLLLDISGSCEKASELMLVFMHGLQELFPKGCKTYVFTNMLYDVSDFFNTPNPETAVNDILDNIPRFGAYSNYEIPFKTFYEEHLSEITSNTYLYIIGDARNNNNETGEEYLKAFAKKSKKTYWLNTDSKNKWDVGDSIIGVYSKYVDKVVEIQKPKQLLQFIEREDFS